MSRAQIMSMLQRQISQEDRGGMYSGGAMSGGAMSGGMQSYNAFRMANPGLSRYELSDAWARHKAAGGWIGQKADMASINRHLAGVPAREAKRLRKEAAETFRQAMDHPDTPEEYREVGSRILEARSRLNRKAAAKMAAIKASPSAYAAYKANQLMLKNAKRIKKHLPPIVSTYRGPPRDDAEYKALVDHYLAKSLAKRKTRVEEEDPMSVLLGNGFGGLSLGSYY